MLIGYARVSKGEDQTDALQLAALKKAGCERIYREAISSGRWDRPELNRMLDQLRPKDTLVVWKLDRLSRSLKDLLHILDRVEGTKAGFISVTENFDTSTPAGRAMMQMVGVFAEFERGLIRERTKAGLQIARAQGRMGGRPPKLDQRQRREIVQAVRSGRMSAADMARLFKVSPATISRVLRRSA